jgi:hypothetical protein
VLRHIAGWDMIKRLSVAQICPDFVEAYNEDLSRLGCRARVAAPVEGWHAGSLQIVDLEGNEIGIIPHSVETIELAAFLRIIDKSYLRGIEVGQSMTGPARS